MAIRSQDDLNELSGGSPHWRTAKKGMKNLPCDEAFQATHDLSFAAPFFQPPRRIGLGLLVPTQTYHDDAMQRGIGLAVTSAIEAMTVGFARTGGQVADAT